MAEIKWTPTAEKTPTPYVSVLAYIQSQVPFPAVREAFFVDDPRLWPFIPHWHVPSLEGLSDIGEIFEVTHWAEMPEGPKCSTE